MPATGLARHLEARARFRRAARPDPAPGVPLIQLHPIMVVRSAVSPSEGARFRHWYASAHIPDVLGIPGIEGYATVQGLPAHRMIAVYQFADESVVQAALNSPQAFYARGTWEQWRQHLQELTVEIYAPLAASAALRHWN